MNIIDALNARFTCRAFKPEPVDRETVVKIMEAANRAPSWGNTQPWDIYVATGSVLEDIRAGFLAHMANNAAGSTDLPMPQEWPAALQERYKSLGKARFNMLSKEIDKDSLPQIIKEINYRFFDAPAVIYLCMDRTLTPYSMFDLGSVSQSIMLAAQEFGLDTTPAVMLVLYPQIIRQALAIPEDKALVMGIGLGYADRDNIHNQYRSERRPLEQTVKLCGF
jgi:nitroreductase